LKNKLKARKISYKFVKKRLLPNKAFFVRRAYKLSVISYKLAYWPYQTELMCIGDFVHW